MTFVAAKCFGDRILIASDTMLSDPAGTRRDAIPGRLKAVVLDHQTTVAYAGLADQGIDAIKSARESLYSGSSIGDIEKGLKDATEKYSDQLEFLIASHRDDVSLKRVWDGQISSKLDQACIGQRDLMSTLLEHEYTAPRSVVPHKLEEQTQFSSAFRTLFEGVYASKNVGGFQLTAICLPNGHCYQSSGEINAWDIIPTSQGLTEQQIADRRSGMTQWHYQIYGPTLRGVGVVGAIIPDAGVGYIYAPLLQDQPIEWRFPRPNSQENQKPILEEFQRRIDVSADKVGGGIEVLSSSSPPSNCGPTESELREVLAHATVAAFPTQVLVEETSLWITCGPPTSVRGVRVDISLLAADPVWVLKTTIDRMNAQKLHQICELGPKTSK